MKSIVFSLLNKGEKQKLFEIAKIYCGKRRNFVWLIARRLRTKSANRKKGVSLAVRHTVPGNTETRESLHTINTLKNRDYIGFCATLCACVGANERKSDSNIVRPCPSRIDLRHDEELAVDARPKSNDCRWPSPLSSGRFRVAAIKQQQQQQAWCDAVISHDHYSGKCGCPVIVCNLSGSLSGRPLRR